MPLRSLSCRPPSFGWQGELSRRRRAGTSADLPIRNEQVVLQGEQRGGGPSGDTDLGIDVLGVMFRGPPGDEQPTGDLDVAAPPRYQRQALDLSFGETRRPL